MEAHRGRAPYPGGGDRQGRMQRAELASVTALPWVDDVVAAKRDRVSTMLEEGGPGVALQPIVNLRTWKVIGHEALARFATGAPEGWFDDAGEADLVGALELAAVRNALDVITTTPPDTFFTINVSPSMIANPVLRAMILSAGAHRVVVELTESGSLADGSDLRGVERLRSSGVRFAIDDIGAGFASLQRVLRFEPDFVKIERDLIGGIDGDPKRRALAETLVAFARKTGSVLIAEGIETDAELETLLRVGIRYGQGFRIGRPQLVRSPLAPGTAPEWFGLPGLEPKYHSRRRRRTVVVAVAASLAISGAASAATLGGGASGSPKPAGITETLP